MYTMTNRYISLQFIIFLVLGLLFGLSVTIIGNLPGRLLVVVLLGCAFPFIAAIIGDVRRFLMAAIVISIPLRIDANFKRIFENQAGASSLGVSLIDIFLIILMFLWFIQLASDENVRMSFFPRLFVPALLYFEACLLTLLWLPRMDLATLELVQMIKVLMLFFIVANQIRNRDDLRLVLWALIATVAFESVLAIIQAASGKRLDLGFLGEAQNDKEAGKMYRVGGTLGHPNRLAMYLELLLPLTLGLFWSGKKKWHRLFALTIFSLGLIAMLLTGSRGGWIGLLFGLVVFFYFVVKTKKLALRAIIGPGLIALLILIAISLAFSDVILHRFQGEDYGSAESRIPMIQIALNLIAANPVGGVGINNYQVVMHRYNNSIRALRYISIDRPVHNMYLLITGETGLIGFTAFAILLFMLFTALNRATKSRDLLLSITAASLFAGYAGFMAHGLVDKHSPGGYALFYVMLAVSAVVYYTAKREENSL